MMTNGLVVGLGTHGTLRNILLGHRLDLLHPLQQVTSKISSTILHCPLNKQLCNAALVLDFPSKLLAKSDLCGFMLTYISY